eukprot:TRINITY_DN5624_c0_g1_i1.p1 TRINITY_DN5624_c0_g1~~TRINITY_DN5624_c0_g1_i1.p1  ORF type:complete len:137 (+),score=43.84 TRINITY_DN5624_c0_g1_i1:3-413(+)
MIPSSSSLLLSGRFALVSGGSRGIGLAIAHELASQGARVALLARDKVKLHDAWKTLPQPTTTISSSSSSSSPPSSSSNVDSSHVTVPPHLYVPCDLSIEEDIVAAVTSLQKESRDHPDILVNAAGKFYRHQHVNSH